MRPRDAYQAIRHACGWHRDSDNVLVVNGHPDPSRTRYCSALCDAYVRGATASTRMVRRVDAGTLLSAMSGEERAAEIGDGMAEAERFLDWADRLLLVFPLWLDHPPVEFVRLFEDLMRKRDVLPARLVVTMDLPAFAHRAMLRANASRIRSQLAIPGVKIEQLYFIGGLGSASQDTRRSWLQAIQKLGASDIRPSNRGYQYTRRVKSWLSANPQFPSLIYQNNIP